MAVGKSRRFQVFDRDKFRCRYCGRTPDDEITLEVDHVIPVSKGGSDEIENLVTSCFDCNRGKSNQEIGAVAPESDEDRLRRLQELREIERASEEVVRIGAARERLLQDWVNTICEIAQEDSADIGLARTAARLQSEFGTERVIEWLEIACSKCGGARNKAAAYLNGIARKVREEANG